MLTIALRPGLIGLGRNDITMGNPRNYSLELPDRCLELLDGLWDTVANDKKLGARHGGPLSTTFLLSLATPIVVLPTERILKQHPIVEGSADDWHLDQQLADRLRLTFTPVDPFQACPFFSDGDGWSYARHEGHHNFARGIPDEVAAKLAEPEAKDAATKLSAVTVIQGLRNALAHGSIAYLDKDGSGLHGSRAEMIAFISERRDQCGEVVGYHVLRISEDGFRSFLHRWVDWLNDTGLSQALAA